MKLNDAVAVKEQVNCKLETTIRILQSEIEEYKVKQERVLTELQERSDLMRKGDEQFL